MKNVYPKYKRGDLEIAYKNLNKQERKIIDEFIGYCSISAGERKILDIKRSIIQFRDVTEVPFEDLNLKTLHEFLALLNKSERKKHTKNGIKIYLKRFLKWKFKNWSERFNELRDIRLVNGFNEEKINEGNLLKKEQIESIMKKEKNILRKTFFITLYESGLRPQELRTLKWKDVNLNSDGDLSEIHIYASKTSKARTVFVKEATFYLQNLEEQRDSEFLFPSREGKDKPISKESATLWIKSMGRRVGIDIFPYLLRHSRATELYLNMPSKVAQKFMGHGTDMTNFYTHLSSKDVKDATLKTIYNFEELPPEKKSKLEKEVSFLRQAFATIYEHITGDKVVRFTEEGELIIKRSGRKNEH